MDASERSDISADGFSIEHILPESPTAAWQQNFTENQLEDMVYRLGNLTPLEAALNRTVGNAIYPVKREAYQRSAYQLARNIPAIAAEEWTPHALAARQRSLAERAVRVWRSEFLP